MFAHWAPLSDDTKTTRATFQQWVFTVPALSELSIPWAQATCTPDRCISVAISNDRQLATLRDIGPFSQMTKSTSLAQWFNKYHAGLEVMGSIPMGYFHI